MKRRLQLKLKVKLVRSRIGAVPKNMRTVAALGLRKVGQEVIHDDNPCIRGMIMKVKHLVNVSPVEDGDAS